MVRRRQRERSVWEVVLPDANKLWPDALRRIDQLIDDEALVEVIAAALERRWAQSRRRGRPHGRRFCVRTEARSPARISSRPRSGRGAAW